MKKQKSIKGLLIYLLIGTIAIFSLYLLTLSTLSTNPPQSEQLSEMMGISGPPEMLALFSQIPNFILFIIALVIGFFTAHRVGLKSVIIHPYAREKPKSEWIKGTILAIILGSIAGVVLRGFDYLLLPFLPDGIIELLQPYNALEFISALFYGGIVEELLLRFGVMSLLVFIFWKLFDRKSAKPSNWVFILAIFVSTLLFALGHYGPTALATKMTALIWFRMILLNGLPGFFFGWIYWRHNLELSMFAHMITHITMNLLMLILSFFM
ncbi:CPBP family intramembrane glutamic endopeptidase [Oceanobacillus sp. AG]|uniref:CPBP family intramembrane glutamic endopeptidase n=1 Tax=Oceanobacillus sp. AG TaxID=2681969 RepID=UPI0018DB7497|nr:CPBP family intramembrane glutamic endopeptidase [Oceanobacillus sp. AG]